MRREFPPPDTRLADAVRVVQLAPKPRDLIHLVSTHKHPRGDDELAACIHATPFTWREPSKIPTRDWLYGHFLIRGQISLTVAPGGTGKSSLVAIEALSQVTGSALLHDTAYGRSRVWIWNGEDPADELQRRIAAACLHYGITDEDIAGRLFVDSGRDREICIARMKRNGIFVAEPVVEAFVKTIRQNNIDIVHLDPFVSCHAVPENDNGAIDKVVKTYARIADLTGCAIHLVHHSRKTGGDAVEVEHARGAVALIAAARAARTLNPMTGDEAEKAGVENRFAYVRIDDGKANLAPLSDKARWLRIESTPLWNGPHQTAGDDVAVVTPWHWPDAFDGVTPADLLAAQQAVAAGRWRENIQAREWVGLAIAKALRLDPEKKAVRQRIKQLLRVWIANGMFVVVMGKDEKGNERAYVEVGTPAAE
jgi:hypothetical protein